MNVFYNMLYTCDQVRDFMYDYLEGHLPMLTSIRYHLHLNACPACREYLFLYRKAANAEQFRKENPPPDELLSTTLDFLKREGIVGEEDAGTVPEGPRPSG
ncbi:MAG: zf-HC2 domain-containing protein [Fibrobacteres bacterium]|nr:zf-HC2 domain-containing protein [Fibrobacterota bacterium]